VGVKGNFRSKQMELQGIKIQNLFGQFDYAISLNQHEGITILTGPNGYGKTTILNIIYHFFKQNFFFFRRLVFENIVFCFPKNRSISITKKIQTKNVQVVQNIDGQQRIVLQQRSFTDIHLILKEGEKQIENYIFNSEAENKLFQNLTGLYPSIRKISQDFLMDSNNGNRIGIEDFILQIPKRTIDIINGFPMNKNQIEQLVSFFSTVNVFLIKEQRLLKPPKMLGMINNSFNNGSSFSYTIQNYATELGDLIRQRQAEVFQESQKLDNSFPSRIMLAERNLSVNEFNERFYALTEKQKQLQQFGITISKIEKPEYNSDKADVLSVYLDDAEKKTDFFDDLVTRINLFVTIINEKKFAYKKISINSNSGFYFSTDKGSKLDLTSLSSGEQEEVVVLYELLFKTHPNDLILIDEPEISLHVSWQKDFVNDLLSISDVKHISFLLATHSPQVVNSRWDMTTDLYELVNGQKYMENE
jgi:predicted ATP-binding protein involved in virulence